MRRFSPERISTAAIVAGLLACQTARATKIEDITRLDGERTNTLTGLGLVMGLRATGDGGAYLPAMRPLAQMLDRYSDRSVTTELGSASNVAIVMVTAETSSKGESSGDMLDITVSSVGAASSLAGGTLFPLPLLGPKGDMFVPKDEFGRPGTPIPFAMAQGTIEIEDPTKPTVGVIHNGARMEADLKFKVVDRAGKFELILDSAHASRSTANMIAKLINESGDSGEQIATAVDGTRIVVQIPKSEQASPVAFIANIQQLPLPTMFSEAEVYLNDRTGTMVITGDVEISPVVISQKGLTITIVTPPPVATVRTPVVTSRNHIPLDTTNTGGAKLEDLAKTFDQLKVPAEDRVVIIKQLYKTGKLHAKLVIDGGQK
jgi:flagellar P-ring protein precursor FlgI